MAECALPPVNMWVVSPEPWKPQNYHLVRCINQVQCEMSLGNYLTSSDYPELFCGLCSIGSVHRRHWLWWVWVETPIDWTTRDETRKLESALLGVTEHQMVSSWVSLVWSRGWEGISEWMAWLIFWMTGWIRSGDETDKNRVIRAEEDMAGSAMIGDLDLVYKYFLFSSMFWPLTICNSVWPIHPPANAPFPLHFFPWPTIISWFKMNYFNTILCLCSWSH